MLKEDKKGLSPVIATVLLIALVLVASAIIFLWARSSISEQIQKSIGDNTLSADAACSQIEFTANIIEGATTDIEISNQGNIPIYRFDIQKISGGNTVNEEFDLPVEEGQSISQELTLDLTNVEKIKIYPTILGTVRGQSSNKPYVCLEKGQEINL